MRSIGFTIAIALGVGCVSPAQLRSQISRQDELAVLAAIDTLPSTLALKVVSASELQAALQLSPSSRPGFVYDRKSDSLTIADPATLPRCADEVRPRCELIKIEQFVRRAENVEISISQSLYRGCGFARYKVLVKSGDDSARVVRVQSLESGSCGVRPTPG